MKKLKKTECKVTRFYNITKQTKREVEKVESNSKFYAFQIQSEPKSYSLSSTGSSLMNMMSSSVSSSSSSSPARLSSASSLTNFFLMTLSFASCSFLSAYWIESSMIGGCSRIAFLSITLRTFDGGGGKFKIYQKN